MDRLDEADETDNSSEVFVRLDVVAGTVELFDPASPDVDGGASGRPGKCPRCT